MTIKITADMLFGLCGGKFTCDACEAICKYCEECEIKDASIGDICIAFYEVDAEEFNEEFDADTECVVAFLDNGNVLIAR